MKKRIDLKKIIGSLVFCGALACTALYGCGKSEPIDCPFTELGWDTTEEELFAAEGDYISSYDSTYGGTTYTYERSYMNKEGTVKYMYDENGVLMNVAWAYGSTNSDELKELYDDIHAGIEEEYGESGYQASGIANYGDTWEMKEGNILLSVMDTDTNKALQVAYVNPLNAENKEE